MLFCRLIGVCFFSNAHRGGEDLLKCAAPTSPHCFCQLHVSCNTNPPNLNKKIIVVISFASKRGMQEVLLFLREAEEMIHNQEMAQVFFFKVLI